ncbi:glycosyltransferase [Virgibacillus pantothenticus]|uniref:glycosyltransferase n=1 Tax=Virgibacillus pantothenticus TaxID=1473 RepID=UPI000986A20A|nr:glycosyltransferase [Virgibacillus pantothenticus]
MKTKTPVILVNSLNVVRGGLTKAVFTRANTLAKEFKAVYIFTFLYQQHYQQIINEIYSRGLLNKNVIVLNLFEDLKPYKKKIKKSIKHPIKEKGLICFQDMNQQNPSYRYYKDGVYCKYKRFDRNGKLLFVDIMNDSRHRLYRNEFDFWGYLNRIRHMDNYLNKSRLDRYFDIKGNCYLTIWVNPNNNSEKRAVLFEKDPREFETIDQLKMYWLNERLNSIKNPVLMVENRNMDNLVLDLEKIEGLKRVAVIHNNHLKKPFNKEAEIKDEYKNLFNRITEYDSVIFLTNEQKSDVQEQFGSNNNLKVIPHPATQVSETLKKEFTGTYNSKLAVTLARYVPQKRLDEAINAFKYVVQKLPDAEYHIFGFGKEKDKLKKMITDLGLENNVKLKDFTTDPMYTYKQAACSILTSDFEGFGMVITESLSAGTPVVSYDSKYGPSDIIRDGIDGYLVEKGSQKKLAEKIVQIMEDDNIRKKLSINAIEVNNRFSVENYAKSWKKLLLEL